MYEDQLVNSAQIRIYSLQYMHYCDYTLIGLELALRPTANTLSSCLKTTTPAAAFIIKYNNWEANHPYSQGSKSWIAKDTATPWLPAASTHYDHGAQPRSKMFDFSEGGKPDGLENPCGTAENKRTTQLTYGSGRESNRGHLGERRPLYAHANHTN